MTVSTPETGANAVQLPLYRSAVPLAPARHGDLALLRTEQPFGFARDVTLVPLTVDEFEFAMLAYPIVFVGPKHQAAVVVGLKSDHNLFVSDTGAYAPGIYIPGYLRCHPFALAVGEDGQRVVYIDEGAELLVPRETPDADPLFIDGKPSPAVERAIALCRSYADAEGRTAAFVELAEAHGIMESRQAHFRPRLVDGSTGNPKLLLDYSTVARERIDRLDAEALTALRDGGALAPAYAQIFSRTNWEVLTLWAE